MSKPTFTPGPWETHGSHIYAPGGAIIATVNNPGATAADYPLVPNRNVMAAAPQMYEALEKMLSEVVGLAEQHPDAVAALRKARGES